MCTAATCAAVANCELPNKKADGSADPGTALDNTCALYTAFTKPAVGEVGDEVGVLIWSKTATKKIPGIRIGRRVLANTNCVQDATAVNATEDVL
jgi:hypothetical protein